MDRRSVYLKRYQANLIMDVKKLLENKLQLQKEEAELCKSMVNDVHELTNSKGTLASLKERLAHCHAAMEVLNEIMNESS